MTLFSFGNPTHRFQAISGNACLAGETLRKDHKKDWDRILGPKSRLLVNGKRGPNAGLANLCTRILRPIRSEAVDREETEVCSTKELLHHQK